jgi:hypothetical protein
METEAPAQVKLLFEYTKFHIGLYATLIAALMGLMKVGVQKVPTTLIPYLKFTLACFVIAGAAGGVIASSISVDYTPLVRNEAIGPFGIHVLWYRWWAHIEHFAFWIGILVSVVGFLKGSQRAYPGHQTTTSATPAATKSAGGSSKKT